MFLFFWGLTLILCFLIKWKVLSLLFLFCIILFIHEVAIVADSIIEFPCVSSTMAFSTCFCHSKIAHLGKSAVWNGVEPCNKLIVRTRINLIRDWSFNGGSRIVVKQKVLRLTSHQKASPVYASLFPGSQLASSAFTIGTTAVLPFYTLMVLAPNSKLTKKCMQSNVPYVILGILYAYLLYLSWTPETIELLFASKYLLPELTSIGKMFSNEMTLASAWIHLLVIDLFAARQVFLDGQENQIETRHSVSLCLFFCPIGILSHVITKAMTKTTKENKHGS